MMQNMQTSSERRRLFWSSQPGSNCEPVFSCGQICEIPGIALVDVDKAENSRTVATNDWLRGLALNMLMTDGRKPNSACGYNPRSLGGHWSESFDQSQGAGIGSLILETQNATSVNETLNLIVAYAQATLDRLIARGVAVRVDVSGEYLGSNRYSVNAEILGLGNNSARVGVTGERLQNGWVWS